MSWWRSIPALLSDGDLVLVTVVATQGSAPRDAGASMLVSASRTADTIGGGHLEWQAMAKARSMLQQSEKTALKRFALGPSLGQCCGGVVWLLFEAIEQKEKPAWQGRIQELDQGKSLQRQLRKGKSQSDWAAIEAKEASCQIEGLNLKEAEGETAKEGDETAGWTLEQSIEGPRFTVTVFGAGHVGACLVRVLAPLDGHIRWVDEREELLQGAPEGVECLATDAPEEAVTSAPPNSYYVVLTHSHALDYELTEKILKRGDFAWYGLIGSKTKRNSFEQKLLHRGMNREQLERITCPIGVPGIKSKLPQAIGIAVAAQILQVVEGL